MQPLSLQFWMDSGGQINYSQLPTDILKMPTDILFWEWFHVETKAGYVHTGTVEEIKKFWHDNVFKAVVPETDEASDLTMEIIGGLLELYGDKSIKKSQTWSGHPIRKRLKFQGLNISIENPAGTLRSGKDKDGKKWRALLHFDYGYIRGTKGFDGDLLDCFIGANKDSDKVFVIHQKDLKTGKFDEDKVMLGWLNKTEAVRDYLKNYNRTDMYSGVSVMGMDEFKKKAYATAKKPMMIKAIDLSAIAKKNKIDISKFDRKELMTGINEEKEHSRDPKTKVVSSVSDLFKIAVTHLQEDPKYYSKLKTALSKAKIKAHPRKMKSGKITQVREHTDKRQSVNKTDLANMKIKVSDGHLTTVDRNAVKALIHLKRKSGAVGKKFYELSLKNGVYTCTITQKDRGTMPVPGSKLRTSKYKSTFTINAGSQKGLDKYYSEILTYSPWGNSKYHEDNTMKVADYCYRNRYSQPLGNSIALKVDSIVQGKHDLDKDGSLKTISIMHGGKINKVYPTIKNKKLVKLEIK